MKKITGLASIGLLITIVFTLMFTSNLQAVQLKEGVHYEVISEKGTDKPEVKEFFSYYCPHCMKFEPLAKKLKQNADKHGYIFEKSHVDFLRAAGPDIQKMLTRALIVAEKLNVPQVSDAIFKRIHDERGRFTSEKDIKNLFILYNVDGDKFDKAFNSFAVRSMANKMQKAQDTYSKSGVLTGVPTFIVNGKYKILTKGFTPKTYGEFFEQLEDAIAQLSKK